MLQARKPAVAKANYSPVERPAGINQVRAKNQFGRKLKLLAILFACFILAIVVVGQYSTTVLLTYRLSNTRADLQNTRAVLKSLEVEAAALGSINRINIIAQDKLGMVEPSLEQLRVLNVAQGENSRQGE